MADAASGANAILRLNAALVGGSDASNYSDVSWDLWLVEKNAGTLGVNGGSPPIPANVSINGGQVWSGGFGYDFRPSGVQVVLIASGVNRVYHNSNGASPGCTVTGYIGATGTSTAGGPTSVSQGVTLPTRTVLPGTPTGVTATRVSDTQIALSWSQSSASNGQPVSNQVERSINGGAYERILDITATNSITVAASPNQKIRYRVQAWNAAGFGGMSAESAPVYTTPAAPTDVTAAKNASLNIVVGFTSNVAYVEREHEVWHGTVSGGVTTWDGSALATLASGTTSYTHTSPNAAQVHVYRVRAKAGTLYSGYATSGQVQLLTAPNAPTLPTLAAFADKAAALALTWTHNPIDSTAQTAYEVSYSTNGGTSWTTTGKVTSTAASRSFAANTWAANVTVVFRVRTWGQATSGGSDGAGGSPWSDTRSVTLKTRPVASVVAPVNSSVLGSSSVVVVAGFSQAEGASFVDAQIVLKLGATTVETRTTTTLSGTTLATRVADGATYTLSVTVRDSNGLTSTVATSTFSVSYLSPVPAAVTLTYLPDTGFVQLDLTIADPGVGEASAVLVTITRTINGAAEYVLRRYPASSEMTVLDTTPTIHGLNEYSVDTISSDDSESGIDAAIATDEHLRAFLSKGVGLADVVAFGGDLKVESTPTVDAALVAAAGRARPIGLYATTGGLVVTGTSTIAPGIGSTPEEIEALLLKPGRGCYRDPYGRRVFGMAAGKISRASSRRGELSFTITETS